MSGECSVHGTVDVSWEFIDDGCTPRLIRVAFCSEPGCHRVLKAKFAPGGVVPGPARTRRAMLHAGESVVRLEE